jgi:hypothetical protein
LRRDFEDEGGGTEADLIRSASWSERDKSTGVEEGRVSEVVFSAKGEGVEKGRGRVSDE